MPMSSPAITAPPGLSRPPSVAAAERVDEHREHQGRRHLPLHAGDDHTGERPEGAGDRPRADRARGSVGMPTSRAESALLATPRMARPNRVFWKSRNSSPVRTSSDEQIADVLGRATPRRRCARSPRGRWGTGCRCARPGGAPQMPVVSALMPRNRAIGDDEDGERRLLVERPDRASPRSIAPSDEAEGHADQRGQRRAARRRRRASTTMYADSVRHLALGEVEVAGAAVHDDEAERDQRVDAAPTTRPRNRASRNAVHQYPR